MFRVCLLGSIRVYWGLVLRIFSPQLQALPKSVAIAVANPLGAKRNRLWEPKTSVVLALGPYIGLFALGALLVVLRTLEWLRGVRVWARFRGFGLTGSAGPVSFPVGASSSCCLVGNGGI